MFKVRNPSPLDVPEAKPSGPGVAPWRSGVRAKNRLTSPLIFIKMNEYSFIHKEIEKNQEINTGCLRVQSQAGSFQKSVNLIKMKSFDFRTPGGAESRVDKVVTGIEGQG